MAEIIDLTGDDQPEERYWKGAVLLTGASSGCISFEEIIGEGCSMALLSSYCVDYGWLMRHLQGIPEIFMITHWDRHSETSGCKTLLRNRQKIHVIHPPFPKFPNYGVMHSKLMLLAYADRMRVVISTANLVEYDYAEIQNVKSSLLNV